MCGIAGLIDRRPVGLQDLLTMAGNMAETLSHRGPDDGGVWAQESARVAFGFRRLVAALAVGLKNGPDLAVVADFGRGFAVGRLIFSGAAGQCR